MANPVSLNSRVWSAKGIKPAAGDEVYSAGEQPIAPYDNWAMWAITRDLYNLGNELGNHADHHEAGGSDELDLQNLKVNGVAALNADTQSQEVRWVNTNTSQTVTRLDLDDNVVRQWPDFAVAPDFQQGLGFGADVTDDRGGIVYDYDAGANGKFHHAKEADHALTADWADVAGALEDDAGNQYTPGDFLSPGDDATITGTWTFNNTVSASIDGNAATADHATTADSATSADHATTAGNSDKVDGYDAQDLIDQASATGEWTKLGETSHADTSSMWRWQVQSTASDGTARPYDLYKLVVYQEDYTSSGYHPFMKLRVGSGGSVDTRYRYHYTKEQMDSASWHPVNEEYWALAQGWHSQSSTHTHYISCPSAVGNPPNHWPSFSTGHQEVGVDLTHWDIHGELRVDYPSIDTFELWSSRPTDRTGRAVLYGKDMG